MLVGAGGPTYSGKPVRADQPIGTLTVENHRGLVTAFLAQHNSGMVGHEAREPMSTIVGRGTQQQLALAHIISLKGSKRRAAAENMPMPTICAGGWHLGEVRAFLLKYYGTDQRPDLLTPMHTLTAKDRLGLVTVQGHDYVIADIGMRMLAPRELYRAQGFHDGYQIEQDADGNDVTKTAQVRMCGNSVCPPVAAAVALAQFVEEQPTRIRALI
jgi:DNA (cytosine-5)-methyltransferase 1